jgi:DtxR family Mn-dependent transcriptional regulator
METQNKREKENLFVGTAEAEHVEMYLKAIWHIRELGDEVKIITIAKMLNVRQPSVVQMLKKLNEQKLVVYNKAGVTLTEKGEEIGSKMMRNSRLIEVMMDSSLKIEINEKMVCGIEHHMDEQFTNALCIMLNHPRKCPHDFDIPIGECCVKSMEQSQKDISS